MRVSVWSKRRCEARTGANVLPRMAAYGEHVDRRSWTMHVKDGLHLSAAVLAVAAGAVHLAHKYLPMQTPAGGSGGPPPPAMPMAPV